MNMPIFLAEVDRLDRAPLVSQAQVLRRARSLLQTPAPQDEQEMSSYWRACSRLSLMLEHPDQAIEQARRSIHWAARKQQWDQLEKTIAYLKEIENDEICSEPPQADFGPLLRVAFELNRCTDLKDLARTCLLHASQLTGLERLAWMERRSGQWEALQRMPPENWPLLSQQLLDRCYFSGETLFGSPHELGDSRSLLLSDLRSIVAVPVVRGDRRLGILFAEMEEHENAARNIRILRYLSGLASACWYRIEDRALAMQAWLEAQSLNELRREIFGHSTLGLAVADGQGHLLEWNSAFENFWPEKPKITQGLWDLFAGQEQLLDAQSLAQLGKSQTRIIILRSVQASRWLQVSDWRVPYQDRIVRAILDLSADEPSHWLRFLEETYHELAADIHDGPAQTAAAGALQDGRIARWSNQLRFRIQNLRSPWVEQQPVTQALGDFLQSYWGEGPGLSVEWQAKAGSAQEITAYRILLTLLDHLGRPRQCSCRLDDFRLKLTWKPATPITKHLLQWTEERVHLLDG